MTRPPQVIVGAKLPLRPMHVWAIRVRLEIAHRLQDLALFDIALDSKLRGCDVVSLRLADVVAAADVQGAHLSTRQYIRLMKGWVMLAGLEPAAYGTHGLRRTKVEMLYRKTGNLRACQLLLGHTKLESTVRYLGVELDHALALSEALEI